MTTPTHAPSAPPSAPPNPAVRYRWRRRAPVIVGMVLAVVIVAMFYAIGVTAYPVAGFLFITVIALVIAMTVTSHWTNHVYPVIAAHQYAAYAAATARAQFAADWQAALDTARVLRANLITGADLAACDSGSLVLEPGERIELWAEVTYAPYYDADPADCEPITVAASAQRIVALTEGGIISVAWSAARALATDPSTGLLAIDVDATTTLVLTGPHTLPLAVYATAKIHDTERLLTDPALVRLGVR